MATTALIVEILVIGVLALVWVALLAFRFLGLDVSSISSWLTLNKDWSNGIVLMSMVISYQLGWSVNQLSYSLARKTINKSIKSRIFGDEYENYASIKNMVFIKGSSFILDKIREGLSVIRLTRSACLNFLLISISVLTLGKWRVGLFVLGIAIALFIQSNDIYARYCQQILSVYRVINQDDQKAKKKTGARNRNRRYRKTS